MLRRQVGGTLSGGEQQMLAIGRALMSRPSLILMENLRSGLRRSSLRVCTRRLTRFVARWASAGILVEQNVAVALTVATRAYVLMRGSVVLEGDPKSLAASSLLKDVYLGMGSGPSHSYPDMGH